jgi:chromosomal replication initiator protein
MIQQKWDNCLRVIKDIVGSETYKLIFEQIKPISIDEQNVLTLGVPNSFFYEYLEENYVDLLKRVIRKELGPDAKLVYSLPIGSSNTLIPGNNETRSIINKQVPVKAEPSIRNPFVVPGLTRMPDIPSQLNPEYSFTNFIEGDCNNPARSVGLAVAEKPGQTAFNPMFIHGGSGLGKTHLAQAIGIKVKEQMSDKIVLYVNATKFTSQFSNAAYSNKKNNNNGINDFIHFYQCIDVLIIDDVQEFVSKTGTQNTFFEIFNHLHQSGKQLIITSDKPPAELQGIFNERMLSRFKWGLVTELKAPDYQTRLAILRHRAYRDGIVLSDNVLEFIAKNIVNNVRELEGALIGLLAQATFSKKAITLELAQATIDKLVKHTKRVFTVDYILKVVADYYCIDENSILSNTRKREIVTARQVAMYFSKQLTKTSLKSIGVQLGKKDHATVLHACRTIDELMIDKKFKMQIEEIEEKLVNS